MAARAARRWPDSLADIVRGFKAQALVRGTEAFDAERASRRSLDIASLADAPAPAPAPALASDASTESRRPVISEPGSDTTAQPRRRTGSDLWTDRELYLLRRAAGLASAAARARVTVAGVATDAPWVADGAVASQAVVMAQLLLPKRSADELRRALESPELHTVGTAAGTAAVRKRRADGEAAGSPRAKAPRWASGSQSSESPDDSSEPGESTGLEPGSSDDDVDERARARPCETASEAQRKVKSERFAAPHSMDVAVVVEPAAACERAPDAGMPTAEAVDTANQVVRSISLLRLTPAQLARLRAQRNSLDELLRGAPAGSGGTRAPAATAFAREAAERSNAGARAHDRDADSFVFRLEPDDAPSPLEPIHELHESASRAGPLRGKLRESASGGSLERVASGSRWASAARASLPVSALSGTAAAAAAVATAASEAEATAAIAVSATRAALASKQGKSSVSELAFRLEPDAPSHAGEFVHPSAVGARPVGARVVRDAAKADRRSRDRAEHPGRLRAGPHAQPRTPASTPTPTPTPIGFVEHVRTERERVRTERESWRTEREPTRAERLAPAHAAGATPRPLDRRAEEKRTLDSLFGPRTVAP